MDERRGGGGGGGKGSNFACVGGAGIWSLCHFLRFVDVSTNLEYMLLDDRWAASVDTLAPKQKSLSRMTCKGTYPPVTLKRAVLLTFR